MLKQGLDQLFSHKEKVPEAFNAVAKSYDLATFLSQGYYTDLEYSASLLDLKGGEEVLDLCCGTGKSTRACFERLDSGRITGVDNSAGMLEVARKKFKQAVDAGRAEFLLQDAMHLDLPANSYDAVFTAYGLRNMPDYDQFIGNIGGVLKTGGQLCIHDFSLANRGWAKWFWLILGYGFIVPFCTLLSGSSGIYLYLVKSVRHFLLPGEIVELLEKNGFEAVTIHRHRSWRKPILHTITAVKA